MIKVFIDTNVVLDFLLKRESFYDDARTIMAMGYNNLCVLYISSLSFSNIAYIARKKFTGDSLYQCFSEIRELMHVSSVTESDIDAAIQLRANDFEDSVQYCSALSVGVDCIVTRNCKDFPFSNIAVLSPQEFIAKYLS